MRSKSLSACPSSSTWQGSSGGRSRNPGHEAKCRSRLKANVSTPTFSQSSITGLHPIITRSGSARVSLRKSGEGASSESAGAQAIGTACPQLPTGASLKNPNREHQNSQGEPAIIPRQEQHCDQRRQPLNRQRGATHPRQSTKPSQERNVQRTSGRHQSSRTRRGTRKVKRHKPA